MWILRFPTISEDSLFMNKRQQNILQFFKEMSFRCIFSLDGLLMMQSLRAKLSNTRTCSWTSKVLKGCVGMSLHLMYMVDLTISSVPPLVLFCLGLWLTVKPADVSDCSNIRLCLLRQPGFCDWPKSQVCF